LSGALRAMFRFEVEVAAPLELGDTGFGRRRCVPITGGTFTGDHEGVILNGADWQTAQSGNILELSAHYALRTHAGALIEVLSEGVRVAKPEIAARIVRGECVAPTEYYFRTHMRFRTADPALAVLNGTLAVTSGQRLASKVVLDVFEVL
jgi:hypothetical protein